MIILNCIEVSITNIFCRLATWKRVEAAPALTLGYPDEIEADEE